MPGSGYTIYERWLRGEPATTAEERSRYREYACEQKAATP